ncbi:MAG: alpha/beta hydrolase [Gemmatimonadetes bacterium]|nr:alpha/beta hydrolase [Gemmatimonadota bacterium]
MVSVMDEVRQAMARLLALAPAAVASRRVLVGGVPWHFLEAGAGPPLLLLHGGGGGGANWYRLFPLLGPSFRLVAPDLPGFGLSPDIPPRPPLGPQAAHLLAAVLDALGLARVSVLGTSFGGLAALRLAQHFPQRVERLVLLDSAGLARGIPWTVRVGTRPLLAPLTMRPAERGSRWLLRRLLTSTPLAPDHERALVGWLAAVGRAHSRRPLQLFAGWRGQREVLTGSELRALALPVLVLWGEHDRFFRLVQAQAAVRHLAGGRLQVLSKAGHSPNWECPGLVAEQVTRFLSAQH